METEPGCLQKAESWVLGSHCLNSPSVKWAMVPACCWHLLLSIGSGLSRPSPPGPGPAHLGAFRLSAGISACFLLLLGLADGPVSSVALQDPQQVERGVEVVEGDRGISLVTSLLHQTFYLRVQSLHAVAHIMTVMPGAAQVMSVGQ